MNNAFLVRLSMSTWTARKMDKRATKDAKERAGAGDKAGVKVYKSLIAADALEEIQKICNAARQEHRRRTVPWSYDGPGAITAEGYPAYKAAMLGYEQAFNRAVADFYTVYNQEREAAKGYLGDLFDPEDYPTTADLAERFAFSVTAEPMPDADHFRVQGLAPELVQEVKQDLAKAKNQAVQNANNTAWGRVIEAVEKLQLKLDGYRPAVNGGKAEGVFHDTLVENITQLAELIPSINIAGDPQLARMQQVLVSLSAYTAQDLREDATLRSEVAREAGRVLSQIREQAKRAA